MNFITKFNQLSGKVRLAIFISALWLLFSVVPDWKEGKLFGCLVFGVIPLVIIWGFWWIAVMSQKDADLADAMQDFLNEGISRKRKFARLVYPTTNRPTLKYKDHELEIIDISEKGLKLFNDSQIDLDQLIHGEAILLSGRSIHVDGEISWSLNNKFGLLKTIIPSSIIAEERRILSRENFKLE